jgi:hypothetical protein
LPFIDGFHNLQRRGFVVEALPPKCEQFARSKSIGHIQFKQAAILQIEFHESKAELFPGQSRRVDLSQLRGDLRFARRIDAGLPR